METNRCWYLEYICGNSDSFGLLMAGAAIRMEGSTPWPWWCKDVAPLMLIGIASIVVGIFVLRRKFGGWYLLG